MKWSVEQLTRGTSITASAARSRIRTAGDQQCQWHEAPVSRTSRQLYQPVHWLARHWVLSGRQFDLSDIADVLLGNATALLVSNTRQSILYF